MLDPFGGLLSVLASLCSWLAARRTPPVFLHFLTSADVLGFGFLGFGWASYYT